MDKSVFKDAKNNKMKYAESRAMFVHLLTHPDQKRYSSEEQSGV